MFGSGWANNCPNELISLGWIPCDETIKPEIGNIDYEPIGKKQRLKRDREEQEALAFVASFMEMIE